jgi:pyridoxal phosphate enzyme (YggS family)
MNLQERYENICGKIEAACKRAKRDPSSVTLVAVSKTHPPESVNELARLGIQDFGENKVQEAKAKIPECSGALRWHGIGHLQTNKARDAVRLFSIIHSVDSLKLAQELSKQASAQSKHLPILLEVNVSGEGTKFGLKPEELFHVASEINKLSHLELQGLMTIAPYSEESEAARPFFRKLAELKKELETKLQGALPHLSMGMSGDFEVAIEEGSTMVRIGTALLGERRSSAFRKTIEPQD